MCIRDRLSSLCLVCILLFILFTQLKKQKKKVEQANKSLSYHLDEIQNINSALADSSKIKEEYVGLYICLLYTSLCITHPLQFLIGQFQASIHVIHIRPEINTESSRIRIGSQIGFDIIDQSSAFAKGHIQFTIHSGTSKDIIQQIECSTCLLYTSIYQFESDSYCP